MESGIKIENEKQAEDKHSMQSVAARRQGHNKLVYDKTKKTIVTVSTAGYTTEPTKPKLVIQATYYVDGTVK